MLYLYNRSVTLCPCLEGTVPALGGTKSSIRICDAIYGCLPIVGYVGCGWMVNLGHADMPASFTPCKGL